MGSDERFKQAQQARERQEFARAVATEGLAPADRFGNPLQAGQFVLYSPPVDLVYKITDVMPVLDPRFPAGLCDVTLQITTSLKLPVRVPNQHMIVLGREDAPGATAPDEEQGQQQESQPPQGEAVTLPPSAGPVPVPDAEAPPAERLPDSGDPL